MYGARVFTRLYEAAGVAGRIRGFQLGTATTVNAELEETFSYTADGRFENLTAGRDSNAVQRTFHYAYLANSALVQSLSITGSHPFTITREFEAHRDLLTAVYAQLLAPFSFLLKSRLLRQFLPLRVRPDSRFAS